MIKISSSTNPEYKSVYWAITKFCDKACHYCAASEFVLTTKKKGNVLNYSDEDLALHDHIAEMLPILIPKGNILFFGGEPTLHPKCIEYFNDMCRKTRDNKDLTLFLITHGDVDEDIINAIDTHGKDECVISISYHHYQVKDFDRWVSRAKMFNERFHTIVSAIVPRRPAVWDSFEEVILKLVDSNIPYELKAEFDAIANEPDFVSLKRFEQLHIDSANSRTEFLNSRYNTQMYFNDGVKTITIPDVKDMGSIPIVANNTLCSNKTLCIVENLLTWSCGEGNTMPITIESTIEDVQAFANQNRITCPRNSCTENRQVQSSITVLGTTLEDKRYQDFFKIWGSND